MAKARSQQDLQNVAFGETATPAERRAALLELAALAEASHPVPAVVTTPVESAPAVADPAGPELVLRPRRRGRPTGAVLLAAALIVGLVVGSAITAQLATRSSAASDATSNGTTAAVTGNPNPVLAGPDSIAHADALFATKATAADTYPTAFDLDQTIIPSSTRLVATAGAGERIFIARKSGSGGGFCLLSATLPTTGPGASGSTTCADPSQFARQGLSLGEDTFNVLWVGGSIDVTVGANG